MIPFVTTLRLQPPAAKARLRQTNGIDIERHFKHFYTSRKPLSVLIDQSRYCVFVLALIANWRNMKVLIPVSIALPTLHPYLVITNTGFEDKTMLASYREKDVVSTRSSYLRDINIATERSRERSLG